MRSFAGYWGALAIVAVLFIQSKYYSSIEVNGFYLTFLILFVLFAMILSEIKRIKTVHLKKSDYKIKNLDRSTTVRFITLFAHFLVIYLLLVISPYYSMDMFKVTREFYFMSLVLFTIFGWFYLYFTLKRRSSLVYEFNDYALLLLIGFRGIIASIKNPFRLNFRLNNKRVRKVYLVFTVNIFFSTLMVMFLQNEYTSVFKLLNFMQSEAYESLSFYKKYEGFYLIFYHGLLLIDVGVALVGYMVASRWLGNRTKSVEMTLRGWFVALICYPPFNSFVFDYGSFDTYEIITSDIGKMAVMTFVLILFTLYVWGTVELGFKFSNLTNRGIITTGPYSIIRHPAYFSKNLSWWIQSSFVFTNIWATLILLGWNIVYTFRALTEETHLKKDKEYVEYMKKVKYRFIPGVW